MEHIAEVLEPIKVLVWGELAMSYLGAPIVYNSFMVVPAAEDFSAAVKRMLASIERHGHTGLIHKSEIQKYKRLDQHSVRFNFPSSFNIMKKVVLLQSHSVHLSPPSAVQISTAPHLLTEQFSVRGNLYYPNKVMLLGSFIRVLLVEEAAGGIIHSWALLLGAWAISYICGMLDVGVDALDTCEDERVRAWYNKNIRRDQGGLNRAINKRAGRMERRSVITSAE